MRDLTQGPIYNHIIMMAIPMAIGMFVQTLYFMVDLYFVSRLGSDSLAGVSAAGACMFIVMALTQMLSVGTVTLISHAVGGKDQDQANLVFNQSLTMSFLLSALTLIIGYYATDNYMNMVAANSQIAEEGTKYLYWFLPGLALQFALTALGSALRGTGVVKPTMIVQLLTVLLNIILAPILIAGWGTGIALGVAGAGLASSLSIACGLIILFFFFIKLEHFVKMYRALMLPQLSVIRKMLNIGIPAGGEFLLMFVFISVVYWVIRDFGTPAQAGFGIGMRIMQLFFLPGMAISTAIPAIAGQNFGARLPVRVRETLQKALILEFAFMVLLLFFCQYESKTLVILFSSEPEVIASSLLFLRIISWNFIATGLVMACSGMFQALGETWPALATAATRIFIFAVPAIYLSLQPGFKVEEIWYLSVVSVIIQAILSLILVYRKMNKKLGVLRDTPIPAT